jgi:hypothetical protein
MSMNATYMAIAIVAMFALTGAVVLSVTASPAAACCARWDGNSDNNRQDTAKGNPSQDHREDYEHT